MTDAEKYYADLSDQHLKNLANGLVNHLRAKAQPESAYIVRELLSRLDWLRNQPAVRFVAPPQPTVGALCACGSRSTITQGGARKIMHRSHCKHARPE